VTSGARVCDRPRARADCDAAFARRPVIASPTILILIAAAFVATGMWLMLRRHRSTRRQRMVRDLLDAADALESRLRTARAEIEAVTGDEGDDPVGDAMRGMLRQRLWLRDHSRTASLDQLAEVRESIDVARARIEQQLSRIERARAPLA
jgi:Flp pilus assembly protein TadB